MFCLGECLVDQELRMEDATKSLTPSQFAVIGMKTTSSRREDQSCAICYYDSGTEEKDEGLEQEFAKKTVQPLGRYASLCAAKTDLDYCNVCSHVFHTVCLYKWIKMDGNSGGFTCPVCRGGLQKQRLSGIPELFEVVQNPEFVQHFWENGSLKEEYYELAGNKHGSFVSYYRSGNVELRCTFEQGLKQGTEHHFYDEPTSPIKSQVDFVEDRKHGWSRWYTADSKMIGQAQYDSGQKSGQHVEWYTDTDVPRLRNVEHHLHGKRHGLFLRWSFSGRLLLYGVYVNDEKDGRFCAWYENTYGLKIKEYFINGLKHGQSAEYYEPETEHSAKLCPKEVGTYDHGVRVGIWRTYWSNGQLKTESEHNMEGQRDGLHCEWNRFGKRSKVFRFENDELDGICETYDAIDVPIETATYRNGQLHGLYVLRYKHNGKPKMIKNFNFGQEIFMRWLSRLGDVMSEFRSETGDVVPTGKKKKTDDVIHVKKPKDRSVKKARFI